MPRQLPHAPHDHAVLCPVPHDRAWIASAALVSLEHVRSMAHSLCNHSTRCLMMTERVGAEGGGGTYPQA
eukprot:1143456-Pelagomonas_calceolata.AAC.3